MFFQNTAILPFCCNFSFNAETPVSGKARFSSGMLGRTLRINKSGIMSVYAAVSTVPCCVPVLPCINFAKYFIFSVLPADDGHPLPRPSHKHCHDRSGSQHTGCSFETLAYTGCLQYNHFAGSVYTVVAITIERYTTIKQIIKVVWIWLNSSWEVVVCGAEYRDVNGTSRNFTVAYSPTRVDWLI